MNRLTHDFLLLEDEGENARRNGENDDDEPLRPHTFGHALISEYFTNPDDDVVDGASLLSRLADRRPAFSHFSTSMTADAFEFPAEAGEEPVQGGKKKRSSFWDNLYWQHWRTRRRLLREFNSSDWQEKAPWQKVRRGGEGQGGTVRCRADGQQAGQVLVTVTTVTTFFRARSSLSV